MRILGVYNMDLFWSTRLFIVHAWICHHVDKYNRVTIFYRFLCLIMYIYKLNIQIIQKIEDIAEAVV
jgi:hypothetical protein